MRAPSTYAEWVNCFEQFKEGIKDEETILLMEQGTVEWTKGVAERLTQHLFETIECRLKRSGIQLQKELNNCFGNETALVKAILSTRQRLAVLKRLAHLPAFPEHVKETMSKLLHDYAKSTQKSLEDSSLTDRTGRLRILIKNNPITEFEKVENVLSSSFKMNDETEQLNRDFLGQKSSKRRVIFHE